MLWSMGLQRVTSTWQLNNNEKKKAVETQPVFLLSDLILVLPPMMITYTSGHVGGGVKWFQQAEVHSEPPSLAGCRSA